MTEFLRFKLSVDESGWPPAGSESIPVKREDAGLRIAAPPFLIRGLSVDDIVTCAYDQEGYVETFAHLYKSARSTIWVAHRGVAEWPIARVELLYVGCNIESLKQFGIESIDLPAEVTLATLDKILSPVSTAGAFVAFPSLRHMDGQTTSHA